MRIGFFDSGIGGITVLQQALRLLPNEDYIYYADTLHAPYGEKEKEEVKRHIFNAVDFISEQGVKALVIACNTATSIAIEDLRRKYTFPILGMEPAVKPAIHKSVENNKRVLVLATNLTLKERKFNSLVENLDINNIVDSLALPGLVEAAEKFDFSPEEIVPYLKRQFSSFDLKQYGTVVLGCTHFPYFKDILTKMFAPNVDIIDGGMGTVKNLKRILDANNQLNDGTGDVIFFESGSKVEDEETLSGYKMALEILNM